MKRGSDLKRAVFILAIVLFALTFILVFINSVREKNNVYITIDPDTVKLVQLDAPKEGDPIAIVDTTLGEVRFVLYPEYSPKAVKNFTELAESGYYDGTFFFNCDAGAFAAGGSKSSDGSVNTSDPRELIPRELNQDLWPLRGAVCLMNTTVDKGVKEFFFGGGAFYCGSRFEFVNTIEFTDEVKEEMKAASSFDELTDAFFDRGGVPNFSQQMTIIGQIYEGLEVVEALSNAETLSNGTFNIPRSELKINSVKIGTYALPEDAENK